MGTPFIFWRTYFLPSGEETEYLVSSHGRVFSSKSGKILTPHVTSGYYEVCIYGKDGRKNRRIHRLVAETFLENPKRKRCVNHKDGNKLNNDLSNLEWVSLKENSEHANNTGLIKRRLGSSYGDPNLVGITDFSDYKAIIGYEKYLISPKGLIYSTVRSIHLRRHNHLSGYVNVCLTSSGKSKTHSVHRLVALHFIPNPLGKRYVNHKDGDKRNNAAENLEWTSPQENTQHASDTGLIVHSKNHKRVIQYNLNREEIARYDSCIEAKQKLGINSTLTGKDSGFAGGFLWRLENDPFTKPLFLGAKQIEGALYLILPNTQVYSSRSKKFLKEQKEIVTRKPFYYLQLEGTRSKCYLHDLMVKYHKMKLLSW